MDQYQKVLKVHRKMIYLCQKVIYKIRIKCLNILILKICLLVCHMTCNNRFMWHAVSSFSFPFLHINLTEWLMSKYDESVGSNDIFKPKKNIN